MTHTIPRPSRSLSAVLSLAAALQLAWLGACAPAQGPVPAEPGPVLDLAASVRGVSRDNFLLEFHAADLIAGAARSASLDGELARLQGRWLAGTASARGYNSATHAVDSSALTLDDARLGGVLKVTVKPDRRMPADGQPWTIELRLDAAVSKALPADTPRNPDPEGMRFWTIFPESQADYRTVQGTYTAQVRGKEVTGAFTGRMSPAIRPGVWNMGRFQDGVRFDFDLGTKRQNWNWARLAVLELPRVSDWRGLTGLKVVVATDQPRTDATVTLWLREEDGSWYYLKSAVPLVDQENAAYLRFEDFAEAEWVAPGSHMDEDYVLDLGAVSHLAIGVVNSLGVGKVSFTVKSLELVRQPQPPVPAAELSVTGRTLAINDHNVIPAGIFGGYAGDLPARFRPGCQRYLYASSYPRVPRQHFARFGLDSFTDPAAMIEALRAPGPAHKDLAGHLMKLVEERARAALTRYKPNPGAKGAPAEGQAPRALAEALNSLLRQRAVYDAAAWAGVKIPDALRPSLEALARDALNDTEVVELNRRLLEAAFAGLIRPVPSYGPTEHFYIDCFGERKEAAILLYDANWKQSLESYGRAWGENCAKAGYDGHWEFWNEPYLNWAERSRTNLGSQFYDTANAREGGPVQVKYKDGTLGPVIPHFQWVKDNKGGLKVVDTSAFSYWSGSGNEYIYNQMLSVAAPAIKKANPRVQVIAGWGFRWNEDHWASWETLYKPTIDQQIQWIDAIHEHHYQGDTLAMNGSYEVLVAYGVARHNKWLHIYNTETSDLVDAPARGAVDTPEKADRASRYRKMIYNLRDCLYTVYQSPDKARARTVIHNDAPGAAHGHAATAGESWAEVAYGLMANLRGRLVETTTSDPRVWCLASVDGTDPLAMPPAGTPPTLVVTVFNDHRAPRDFTLRIAAPEGMSFTGQAVVEQPRVDKTAFALALDRREETFTGAAYSVKLNLPERSAWKVSLPLAGRLTAADQVVRQQFFAPDILQRVTRGQPQATTIKLDPALLARARKATLRVVVEDVGDDEAQVAVGRQTVVLPRTLTADNVCLIREVPLDLQALSAENAVKFTVQPGNHAGYLMAMSSIVLETGP